MIDIQASAAALYGDPAAPAPAAAAEPASAPAAAPNSGQPQGRAPTRPAPEHPLAKSERLADGLYAQPEDVSVEVPESIANARKGDELRTIYGAQGQFGQDITDAIAEGSAEFAAFPEDMRKAAIAEVREIAADVGMTNEDVSTLKALAPQFNATTAEQVAQWQAESVQTLQREYGEEWQQALADAKALIARDPRLVQIMRAGGRGNHPQVVSMFARLGRQARMSGRIK